MRDTRIGESQRQILDHLKRRGSGTVPELAEALQVSVETVRTHLKALGSQELVLRQGSRRHGPGRPEIVYGLTDRAHDLFPAREGQTLRELAVFLEEEGQRGVMKEFFRRQGEERLAGALTRLEGLEGEDRLRGVAAILTEEGFMAELDTDDQGRRLLRLCNCPIRDLIDVTAAPCRAEEDFVMALVGRPLERVAYIPSGDAACCYALSAEG